MTTKLAKWTEIDRNGKPVKKRRAPYIKPLLKKAADIPKWKNFEIIRLWEAACLLKNIEPNERLLDGGKFRDKKLQDLLETLISWLPKEEGPRPSRRDFVPPYLRQVELRFIGTKAVEKGITVPDEFLAASTDKVDSNKEFVTVQIPHTSKKFNKILEVMKDQYKDPDAPPTAKNVAQAIDKVMFWSDSTGTGSSTAKAIASIIAPDK